MQESINALLDNSDTKPFAILIPVLVVINIAICLISFNTNKEIKLLTAEFNEYKTAAAEAKTDESTTDESTTENTSEADKQALDTYYMDDVSDKYEAINEVLMNIKYSDSESYDELINTYLPTVMTEDVRNTYFPPDMISSIDGNTVSYIDATGSVFSVTDADIIVLPDVNKFVATLTCKTTRSNNFKLLVSGDVNADNSVMITAIDGNLIIE